MFVYSIAGPCENPDYVADRTYEERYAPEDEYEYEEPWAVYDPD